MSEGPDTSRRRPVPPRTHAPRRPGSDTRSGRGAGPGSDGDVVYGRNAVREALRGRRRVHRLLVSDRAASLELVASASCPVEVLDGDALTSIAGSEDHQGVVARVDRYPYVDAESFLASDRPLIVALDEITDPQNLGAIARTAECAGATGIVLPEHRSASVTAAVCKASAGAVEHVGIARVRNLADWIAEVKGPRLWAYAADLEGALPYTRADLADGAILVIGAEGRGVRPRVLAACDAAVAISMAGRIESLNASVAAGVLLFEARRQRDSS
jgi:23S rRNA (guanosine2251-2'-O)-methyltransferase